MYPTPYALSFNAVEIALTNDIAATRQSIQGLLVCLSNAISCPPIAHEVVEPSLNLGERQGLR